MKNVKFKAEASILVQIAAGSEVDAVVNKDGQLYVLAMKMPKPEASEEEDDTPPADTAPTRPDKTGKKSTGKRRANRGKTSTEKEEAPANVEAVDTKARIAELKEMSAPDLKAIIKSSKFMDLAKMQEKHDVKRWSVASLSKAIAEEEAEFESSMDGGAEPAEEKDSPKRGRRGAKKEVAEETTKEEDAFDEEAALDLIGEYEEEKIKDKEFITRAAKLGVEKEDAEAWIELFNKNVEMSLEEALEELKAMALGEEEKPEETSEEPSDDEFVDQEDLNAGDIVSVYWASLDDWFEGEVTDFTDTDDELPIITYSEDKEVLPLDLEDHTKIKLIEAAEVED